MSRKLSELLKVDQETKLGATVAAVQGSSASNLYDMKYYDEALFVVGMGLKGATIATMSSVTFNLVESSACTAVGTTLIGGKAAIQVGSSLATAITTTMGVAAINLDIGSDDAATSVTAASAFRFGLGTAIVTFSWASEATVLSATAYGVSTAITATQAYFGSGSAVNATANTGGTLLIDNLRNALSSPFLACGGPNIYNFSTPSTGGLTIQVVNSTLGNIFYANTCATTIMLASPMQLNVAIPVRADQLTSTANKRFVGLQWSTLAQALPMNITCIRSRGRYMPDNFMGVLSS